MNIYDTAEAPATSVTVELFAEMAKGSQIAIVFGVVFQDRGKVTKNALIVDSVRDIKKFPQPPNHQLIKVTLRA